jgi:hypothetical protein
MIMWATTKLEDFAHNLAIPKIVDVRKRIQSSKHIGKLI